LVRGIIYFEKKGIKLPQKTTSPNEQRIFPKEQGIFFKEKKKNGNTNHVPLNNNFLREKGINFFWGTISKGE
jgi:hypothetical protein